MCENQTTDSECSLIESVSISTSLIAALKFCIQGSISSESRENDRENLQKKLFSRPSNEASFFPLLCSLS